MRKFTSTMGSAALLPMALEGEALRQPCSRTAKRKKRGSPLEPQLRQIMVYMIFSFRKFVLRTRQGLLLRLGR